MSEDIAITISEETASAILKIEDRYYFDLFKTIRMSKAEEYQFREAIVEIAKQIKQSHGVILHREKYCNA